MWKNILVALIILAMVITPGMARNKYYQVGGCDVKEINLLSGEGNATFGQVTSWTYYDRELYLSGNIANVNINDDGTGTIEPLIKGSGTLLYNIVTEDGLVYDRYATIKIADTCLTCSGFTEEYPMYAPDGSYFEITDPSTGAGNFFEGDANGEWEHDVYLWTCDGQEWTSDVFMSGDEIYSGSVLEVRSEDKESGEVIASYAYM